MFKLHKNLAQLMVVLIIIFSFSSVAYAHCFNLELSGNNVVRTDESYNLTVKVSDYVYSQNTQAVAFSVYHQSGNFTLNHYTINESVASKVYMSVSSNVYSTQFYVVFLGENNSINTNTDLVTLTYNVSKLGNSIFSIEGAEAVTPIGSLICPEVINKSIYVASYLDINADGKIDLADVGLVAAKYGLVDNISDVDITNDGKIDQADIEAILGYIKSH